MNLSDIEYPAQTRQSVRNLLVGEARRTAKPAKRWKTPLVISVAGLALAGTTAAGIYVATKPVDDTRDIRCYYLADLTTEHPVPEDPSVKMPPYITTGIMEVGFDAKNNPNPDDPNAGMLQVQDPVKICADLWDTGNMNPNGITDSLIPMGFAPPKPVMVESDPRDRDPDGNPFPPQLVTNVPGHYIPPLVECVVGKNVAVIPGPPETCAKLGIPALEKSSSPAVKK
ncbi:hypothetical protein AL755_04990 [Arthrobacter sp. ERGS1:01]|uniref:hypothetical protein n=1 Tax=Arthrobacter sp. ERGS1:01 TaxID=1704044 RepID=UPI0006B4689C|nr:hypothetical protein [Arthrobacter sp. ERGS1:01]ALE04995.1 hypothetical protein AL755_04990 [Arthrobacter sp. ERGS1:01]